MKVFVTGGAGFIGRNLVQFLLSKNHTVSVYDKLAKSETVFPRSLTTNPKFSYVVGDVLDCKKLSKSMKGASIIYHLSANADVRGGLSDNALDLTQGTVATSNVLHAMRQNGINKLVFPSSMTVYGTGAVKAVAETYGPCLPISLYGASKLASEAFISAYSYSFGIQSWVLRFANVIGPGLTHGVIFDLINKIRKNPNELQVLGDGNQTKPYIYIDDLLNAIDFVVHNSNDKVNLFNIGTNSSVSVKEIVQIIVKKMKLNKISIKYDKTPYGWVGDVPTFTIDVAKLKKLGHDTIYTSREAVSKTVDTRLEELAYTS